MKDLLKRMLQKDPHKRNSAEELLTHPFFREVQLLKEFQTRNTNTLMDLAEDKEKECVQKV